MPKKNNQQPYTPSAYVTSSQKAIALFVQVAGVVVVILNLWIVGKLAPITSDLTVLATRINAIEKREENNVSVSLFDTVLGRLDRIEAKIDNL